MLRKTVIKPHRVLALLAISTSLAFSTNYYLDVDRGTNGNGSISSPYNSVSSLKMSGYQPGDSILIKRGTRVTKDWGAEELTYIHGTIWINSCSGTKDNPIVIGAYGSGAKPIIDGGGKDFTAAVLVERVNNIVIENLELHNDVTVNESDILDKHSKQGKRWGIAAIYWRGDNKQPQQYSGITIKNNKITNLYGSFSRRDLAQKDVVDYVASNDEISFKSGVKSHPSMYSTSAIKIANWNGTVLNDVLVESNEIKDVIACGISVAAGQMYKALPDNQEYWDNKPAGGYTGFSGNYYNNDFYYGKNVVIRNNYVDGTGTDGIVVSQSENPIMENNTVIKAGQLGVSRRDISDSDFEQLVNKYFDYTGSNIQDLRNVEAINQLYSTSVIAGIWTYSCKDGLIQYNKVSKTKRHDWDGQAFDSDDKMVGSTVFQYNYTEDNEGGFFMDWCPSLNDDGSNPADGNATGTILRYNISQNDAINTIADFGICQVSTNPHLIKGKPNDRLGLLTLGRDYTQVYNNIFYTTGDIRMRKDNNVPVENVNIYNNVFIGKKACWIDEKYKDNPAHRGTFTFDNNAYYMSEGTLPDDANAITANAQFAGTAGTGTMNSVDCYKLKESSPLLNKGIDIITAGLPAGNTGIARPTVDFWGTALPQDVAIGVYEKPSNAIATVLDEDFESGWNGWQHYNDYAWSTFYYDYKISGQSEVFVMGEPEYSSNHAMVTYISQYGMEPWHIHAKKKGLTIKKGSTYRVSLKMRTEKNCTRKVRVTVGEEGGDYTSYGQVERAIDGTLKTYSYTFTMNDFTDYNASFVVSMGDFGDHNTPRDVVIDDILIEEIR